MNKEQLRRVAKANKTADSNERRAIMLGFKDNEDYQNAIKKIGGYNDKRRN